MASDLYNIYLSYKNKNIDDYFITQSFDIFLKKEPQILPYIKDLIITENNDNNLGSYSNENKIITINKNNINKHDINWKNILGLQTLRHEIEHAKNLQKLEQRRNDIESRAIFYSLRSYAILNNLDTTQMSHIDLLLLIFNTKINYDINPGERIADIKSWKYIVNLLKNQRKTQDLLLARKMLYYSYIRGYKDNRYYLDCPTYKFLLNTNQLEELKYLKNRVDKTNYSLNTRLLYGLPISYKEHDKDTLKKVKLQKKLTKKDEISQK